MRHLPAVHSTHAVCATRGWYLPAVHASQASGSVDDATAPFRSLPAAHAEQSVWPATGWYMPVAHATHASVSCADAGTAPWRSFPAAHLTHFIWPIAGWYCPGEHALHAIDSIDAADSLVRSLPVSHSTQGAFAAVALYLPIVHAEQVHAMCCHAVYNVLLFELQISC